MNQDELGAILVIMWATKNLTCKICKSRSFLQGEHHILWKMDTKPSYFARGQVWVWVWIHSFTESNYIESNIESNYTVRRWSNIWVSCFLRAEKSHLTPFGVSEAWMLNGGEVVNHALHPYTLIRLGLHQDFIKNMALVQDPNRSMLHGALGYLSTSAGENVGMYCSAVAFSCCIHL